MFGNTPFEMYSNWQYLISFILLLSIISLILVQCGIFGSEDGDNDKNSKVSLEFWAKVKAQKSNKSCGTGTGTGTQSNLKIPRKSSLKLSEKKSREKEVKNDHDHIEKSLSISESKSRHRNNPKEQATIDYFKALLKVKVKSTSHYGTYV